MLVGKERVYDQELIYARVIGLLASSREIDFNDVLAFELAAYPPSMFKADGKINVATSKSTLKHKLQVTISERNCPISDTMIFGVSVLLWVITWPSGKLLVYVDAWHSSINLYDAQINGILVFDRYFPNSMKSFTRTQRSGPSLLYKLTPDMQAPAKQVVLNNTKNKIQLNAMLRDGILDSGYFAEATQTHTLIIAGVRDVPVEITDGMMIDRNDVRSTHVEADILIAQHAISLSLLGKSVRVVCDDTDVFVLLVHYYNSRCKFGNSAPMIMASPVKERAVIDIRATVESQSDVTKWHIV